VDDTILKKKKTVNEQYSFLLGRADRAKSTLRSDRPALKKKLLDNNVSMEYNTTVLPSMMSQVKHPKINIIGPSDSTKSLSRNDTNMYR
jgi:hypothetical protein